VSELLVTGPAAGSVASLDDLAAANAVYIRPSSSYHAHLVDLNERREADGEHQVEIVPVDACYRRSSSTVIRWLFGRR